MHLISHGVCRSSFLTPCWVVRPYIFLAASCIFTVNFVHPIELVKTRMQVTGDGLGVVVRNTLRNEGVGSFWKGIVWAWGREGSYASIRIGAYAPVRDALGAGKDAPFYLKFLAGAITGGVYVMNFTWRAPCVWDLLKCVCVAWFAS